MTVPHARGLSGPGSAALGSAALHVSPLAGRPGIRACGEITRITHPTWEEALARLAERHARVSYVELADVTFVDIAGVTALAITAMGLTEGRVVVEHPPPQLRRVLDVFWPDLPQIEVAPR